MNPIRLHPNIWLLEAWGYNRCEVAVTAVNMDPIPIIPPFLAILNTTVAALIICGYLLVRKGDRSAHRFCMISALAVSNIFMVFYI